MEAIAALSLASNVIQIVDFSTRALVVCREIYKDGTTSEFTHIEEITKHLTTLQDEFPPANAPGSSSDKLRTAQNAKLSKIAQECSTIAGELIVKLQGLKIEGSAGKLKAIVKAPKTIWEKRKIQDIQKRLDSVQKILNTQILINLKRDVDLTSLQSSRGFEQMDQKLQMFVNGLSQGATNTEQLLKVMHGEHEQTRQMIADGIQQQQSLQKQQEDRKAFLHSLWFDELHSREENIVDAHRKTFEWIFDRSGRSDVPWNNFVEWLETGRGFYWINGKAGSGKSTLMSFVGQDIRLSEMLKVWSATEVVLMPRHYFWSGGQRLEKSVEGLLRSLLWQMLNDSPDLEPLQSGYSDYRAAWTERRLRQLLQHTVQDITRSKHLCFFIDGLDEYDGDQDGLTDLLKGLVQNEKVKICLSSRPYRYFEHAFAFTARLRLQDMTRGDIETFTLDKLQSIADVPAQTVKQLTETILERAEGVFLWVSLAVRDLMRGLRNGDSPKQLEERLARLPDEIDKIYERMLDQIETVYRNEASVYLQIALHGKNSSLLSHVLAVHDGLDDMLGSDEKLPELELVEMSHKARERIVTTCVGLLEISERPRDGVQQSAKYIPRNSPSASSSRAHDITSDVEHMNLSGGHPATDDGDGASSGEEQESEKPSLAYNIVGPNHDQEGSRYRDEESIKRHQYPDFGPESYPRGSSVKDDSRSQLYHGDYHDEDDSGCESNGEDDSRCEPNGEDDSRCEANGEDYSDEDVLLESHYDGESRANDIYHIGHSIHIALVHRSAFDFLQDKRKGGAFLDSHTPSTFHPQVFHVKARLARLRLFGYRGAFPSGIMEAIYRAEQETQVAHPQLCALLDQIMCRIDKSRKHFHWSARWCRYDSSVELETSERFHQSSVRDIR